MRWLRKNDRNFRYRGKQLILHGVNLPGWVVDNRTSVLREAEPYRAMTCEQRLKLMSLLCDDAVKQVNAREDRDAVVRYREPLPQSSVEALARLRAEMAGRNK